MRRVTDRESGRVQRVAIPCGSTRESVCMPCAGKGRRLRMQQCAEGWHLVEDPLDERANHLGAGRPGGEGQAHGTDGDKSPGRRVRSTRRRTDVLDLPRVPVEERSVGRTFTAPDGTTYRPSMFVTLTLGSYGKVVQARTAGHVRGAGARWPGSLRLPAGCDRGDVLLPAVRQVDAEPAPLRGLPRAVLRGDRAPAPARSTHPPRDPGGDPAAVIRAVTRATYLQLWWPPFERACVRRPAAAVGPDAGGYCDPETGIPLPTWEEALDAWTATRGPAGGGDAVRRPGRHQGHHRAQRRRGPVGALPGEVPHQVHLGDLHRPRARRTRL